LGQICPKVFLFPAPSPGLSDPENATIASDESVDPQLEEK
jgi:hypothetical protein